MIELIQLFKKIAQFFLRLFRGKPESITPVITPVIISEVPQNIKDLPFAKRGYSMKTRKGTKRHEVRP